VVRNRQKTTALKAFSKWLIRSRERSYLLGVLAPRSSSLSGFGLDEQIDEEKNGQKSSEGHGKVGTELNFQSQCAGWHAVHNRVKRKRRGNKGCRRDGTSSDLGYLLHCGVKKEDTNKRR
jgi:hypothetical protein